MVLQLRNSLGQISLADIDPLAVAELSDAAQACLAKLITAHDEHVLAQERRNAAARAVHAAQEEQSAALEAHRAASDPFPFVPPDLEHFASQTAYDAAVREARQQHDTRVTAYRESEARKAVVRAYNSSHTGA